MLGIIWSIGEIAKIIKSTMVFNIFLRFRGSKLASFSYVFGVSLSTSFFDRLGVDLEAELGAILAPKSGLCSELWGVDLVLVFSIDF